MVNHKLSNNVGDAFLKFLHKHANLPKKVLPPSTRIGLQFLDSLKKNVLYLAQHPYLILMALHIILNIGQFYQELKKL